jgi:hypothetical protein
VKAGDIHKKIEITEAPKKTIDALMVYTIDE